MDPEIENLHSRSIKRYQCLDFCEILGINGECDCLKVGKITGKNADQDKNSFNFYGATPNHNFSKWHCYKLILAFYMET